ncbi:ATP-binding protein [Maribellus luteus]|uniref:ATP-binding protein n=1 Tax=Maribellus luteus TaxID=2305463 RepID=A0A399T3A4_9BACT|nr:ATP-binding protein [Maribellus luteus]RIJ49252.1 ATP-binding protein [Maribellus luteus]
MTKSKGTESDNPFKYGSVVSREAFCNRKEEIQQLKQYMQNSQSVWLFSPRRYGKTSLIKRVFNESVLVKTLYVDLYNIKSTDDFCKRYAKLIADSLFDWKDNMKTLSGKLVESFKGLKPSVTFDENGNPSFSLQTETIHQQIDVETILNIPDKIGKKNNQKICIAFDEFQEIKRIDPFLINWMRSAFQFHENVSYIFLGSKQSMMESIFSDNNSPFYEFGTKMNLNPIRKEELEMFITDRFKSRGIYITQSVVDKILEISGGHPHYTQFFASEVFYLLLSGHDQNNETFNHLWLTKIINGQSDIFQNIYDQLSNIQRNVLQTLTVIDENTELYSVKTRDKYHLPPSSTLNTTLNSLINKDIIAKQGLQYKLVNPIFKEWLKRLDAQL